MTDKVLLLSKLYDYNTICYRVKFQDIWIRDQENEYIGTCNLNTKLFCLSYPRIWRDVETKTGDNTQEIMDLTSSILGDHLKQKGLTTHPGSPWHLGFSYKTT